MDGVLVDVGAVPAVQSTLAVAQHTVAQGRQPPGQGPEFGKSSPVALVVILMLALATVVLVRSMTKRIKRLPASFDAERGGDPAPPSDRDPGERPG